MIIKKYNCTVIIDPEMAEFIKPAIRIGEVLHKITVRYGATWYEDLKEQVGIEVMLDKLRNKQHLDQTEEHAHILDYLKENLGDGIPEVYEYEQLIKKEADLFMEFVKKKGLSYKPQAI